MATSNKLLKIVFEIIPILLMLVFIPFIMNDYLLLILFIVIIAVSFYIKYSEKDYLFFLFGFVVMIISECLFVSTGVETFNRQSLFGLMPIWLPFLWAYAFVAIKRAIMIIGVKK